jgi:hypothetical protein
VQWRSGNVDEALALLRANEAVSQVGSAKCRDVIDRLERIQRHLTKAEELYEQDQLQVDKLK